MVRTTKICRRCADNFLMLKGDTLFCPDNDCNYSRVLQ